MLQFLALLKSAQTLISSAHSTYILKDAHCDCGYDVGIIIDSIERRRRKG